MVYQPVTAVWEITMNCNMRCKHCGSGCHSALADELTTAEALKLCDDLGEMGLEWITLSGGEPTTREDWPLIAKRLNQNGVIPNMITNGWSLNEAAIDSAASSGINTIGISLDGLEETHDFIRKKGSFRRIMNALDLMREKGQMCGIITTINNLNIKELPNIKRTLIDKKVSGWQLQFGLPMGNMTKYCHLVIKPRQVNDIIDFAYTTMQEGKITIELADCIGYYNLKEKEIRNKNFKVDDYCWQGCPAGKYSFGILHNGDILGCASVRDQEYIEGNIRETPLKEIWASNHSFKWNRDMKKEYLTGFCKKCQYGHLCLGGCANARITMNNDLYDENRYCVYHTTINQLKRNFACIDDLESLKSDAKACIKEQQYQLAEILLAKALKKDTANVELLALYGYVSFMLGNYNDAKRVNQKVLHINPEDAYAHKGLGLSLCRLGEVDSGVAYLKKSIMLAGEDFMDPYYDLAVMLIENGRNDEALDIIEAGRQKSESFMEMSRELYEQLTKDR